MQTMFWACVILVGIQGQAPAAEVQVNVRPAEDQKSAAVAVSPAGGAVIVWSSYFTSVGRSNDILARRLDFSQGGFLGEEFPVNETAAGNQTAPAVAMDGQGRFAVVWHGPGLDQEDIFLRLFQPDGNAITGELRVNPGTAGRQLYPSVTFADANTLVVAWESWTMVAGTETASVCVQRLDPNGVALGDTISADTATYGCRDPQVVADGAGRFAVVWWRERTIHPIVARLFGPDGVPLTDPLEVNTTSIATVTRPSIAMNSRGNFVIVWDGHPERASEDDIYARLYDPNGTPCGEPFVVNTISAGAQQWPQVSMNEANEFMVVWEHDTGDLNATEIAARYFDPNGVPAGEQFQLNTHMLDAQRYPDVAMAGSGSYVAVWESNGQDGSGYGIFATTEPALLWLPPAGTIVEP